LKKGIFLLLFFFIVFILHAQTKQELNSHTFITGIIIDSSSGQPLEYSTISLFLNLNKKPVNGTTSDSSGYFMIKNVENGNYKVVIEYMGYKPFTRNNVLINQRILSLDMKTISLVKKVTLLQAVTIEGNKNIIENKIDKMVFNVGNDLTSQGGFATDILKKVPQVSVDVDGNIELAGSSSIRFLIDGKPSAAFGNNITDVLQSIPASQIKSIEVVTNPGAKYDAQGLGGIINIILKKNTAEGVNGNISLTGNTRQENGSFNFNARRNNFGINAFISGGARLNANTPDTYNRVSKNTNNNTTDLLHQDGNSRFNRHGIETGIGFDWTYMQKNSFSGSLNYNSLARTGNGLINQSQVTTNDATGNIIEDIAAINNTGNSFRFHNVDAGLDYKRTFNKEDRELEVAVNSSFGNNYAKSNNDQYVLPGDSLAYGTNSNNPGIENETEIKIDYTEPFSKNIILGAGGKISFDDINSTSGVLSFHPDVKTFFFDSSLSSNMEYHQKVYALYSELSFPVGQLFDAKIGGRYERTNISSFYSNAQQQPGTSGYNTFVPSVFILNKLSDNETIKFSYSKRIERPDYRDLNPFINTSDPKNITSGNLFLTPEIGNRYELGYNKDLGTRGSFAITAFYRINNHDIQNFIIYYPSLVVGDSTYTNVAVSTRENIGLEKNVGLSLFGDINFTGKLNVRTNVFAFYRHTINVIDTGYNSNSFNYRLNMNVSYKFTKDFAGEFFGNFNSARHEAQGRYPSFTIYSIALRKQIWKKKGSIALTAVNPFNEYVNRKTSVFGPGFTVTDFQKIPYRSIGINFTWKFGGLQFKEPKEDESINLNPPTE
jgi:outer membrane receptor protein involved in Fe transport